MTKARLFVFFLWEYMKLLFTLLCYLLSFRDENIQHCIASLSLSPIASSCIAMLASILMPVWCGVCLVPRLQTRHTTKKYHRLSTTRVSECKLFPLVTSLERHRIALSSVVCWQRVRRRAEIIIAGVLSTMHWYLIHTAVILESVSKFLDLEEQRLQSRVFSEKREKKGILDLDAKNYNFAYMSLG